ncbi:hypothetical protein H2201_000460 [Coniosporium apollinis]|uniref:NECAP PHear domain-containing protein n=1 Tax=Coniosporium apollinis TaxID=61459 RepID=A0ABQ9P9N5_9PEZI|nr:hypothetical protein H2201_000460 [Coniosporium apollinis]
MSTTDPVTGLPLPPDAIQRILYIAPKVHIYNIPPATSTKGYTAATWTANNNQRLIFTARLRVLETAVPAPNAQPQEETVTTTLLLEDPSNGQLFAAAPYTAPQAVEQALDSSRFFAVRVVGEGGRKAVLGIGFEERSDAFDFSIALQDARRVLGFEGPAASAMGAGRGQPGGRARGVGKAATLEPEPEPEKRDFSLKEGEMITVNIGGRGRRTREDAGAQGVDKTAVGGGNALFSIKPPPSSSEPGGGTVPFLPPPPSAAEVKADRRRRPAPEEPKQQTAQELGFDDGEFGEFQ